MVSKTTGWMVAALVTVMIASTGTLAAQSSIQWDPKGVEYTRPELEQLLQRLEQAASSPGYSSRIRDQARQEAAVVRTRLEDGDFQVGDRVVLRVEGEPQLSDTLAVEPGRGITLPGIGTISLAGVLRAELQDYLATRLAEYLQDPVVHASSLIRIAILGQVGQQGFYTIPSSALIEDAIMMAGGPAQGADLDKAEIVRGDRVIWNGDALQEAIIAGRTLDQLSLRAGDRITVPQKQAGFFAGGVLRTLLVTIPPITYMIFRIFR